MRNIFKTLLVTGCSALVLCGCNFLDPLPNGSYNEDNYEDYPKIIRGFVDKAYAIRPDTFYNTEFIGTDAASDNAVYRNQTASMRMFSVGDTRIGSNPFSSIWDRDYRGINYVNMFLKDRVGINTQYLLDHDSNAELCKNLEGDAYALRAWYHYELLKIFGGVGTDGNLLGIPIRTEATEAENLDNSSIKRATFDETVEQILKDCDSAYYYLPNNNRDYPGDRVWSTPIEGAARYRSFDRVSINGLRAMVYLLWASPAYNPNNDLSRYRQAAHYAAEVMKHKLDVESTLAGGFDPNVAFSWQDLNHPEIVQISSGMGSSGIETNLYPQGFGGAAAIVPTQELVDAFPAANGYPITDARSGYDPAHPYDNRDPRMDVTIFHNRSEVRRNTNNELMYTIESAVGGKDAPNLVETSPTSYYIKKFVFMGWNPYDENIVHGYRSCIFMRWEQMCLIFAEAASKATSPTDESTFGFSAKQALSYVRARPTVEGKTGVGAGEDPYLDECAADPSKFDALVKNEWRITTCFEGTRYYDLRRWTANHSDLSAINTDVHGMSIVEGENGDTYTETVIERKNYPSLWCPLPYLEVRRCPNLVQNAGWENWK